MNLPNVIKVIQLSFNCHLVVIKLPENDNLMTMNDHN